MKNEDYVTAGLAMRDFHNECKYFTDTELLLCIKIQTNVLAYLRSRGPVMALASSWVQDELTTLEHYKQARGI